MGTSTTSTNYRQGFEADQTQQMFSALSAQNKDSLGALQQLSDSKDANLRELMQQTGADHRKEMDTLRGVNDNMMGMTTKMLSSMMDFMGSQSRSFNSMTSDYFGSQARMMESVIA